MTWRRWHTPQSMLTCWCALIKSRVVYRTPERRAGRGRPRLHGEPFRLVDEQTHGQPQRSTQLDHALYGAVAIDVWTDLHVGGAPDAPFSVIRIQVERLPNQKLPPRPLDAADGDVRLSPSAKDDHFTAVQRMPRQHNETAL